MFRKLSLLLWVCLLLSAAVQAETLVVGCEKNMQPFVYEDKDGQLIGFDIDILNAITIDLGLTYTLKPMAFTQLISALQAGKIDAALSGISITSAREEKIDFSYPYFDSGLAVMVHQSNRTINGIGDLDDKVVATKKGTTSEAFVRNFQTSQVKVFTEITSAYASLAAGESDAVIFDSPVILHYIAEGGKGKYKAIGRLYKRQSYGIALPSGSNLREKISISILKLREGLNYSTIHRRWFGPIQE